MTGSLGWFTAKRGGMRTFFRHTAVLLALSAGTAEAAYPTKVMSALEDDKRLPDIQVGVGYDFSSKSAQITREWVQVDNAGNRSAIDVAELDYAELVHRLNMEVRVGLFRDLELHIYAPVVLSDTSEIGFSEGVAGRSTIFGSANANDPNFAMGDNYRFPITQVPAKRSRSGFGDMTFGLSWSPLNDAKDEAYPTITLTGDITAPTGTWRDPQDQDAASGNGSGGVGLGQTIFDLSIGASRRMLKGVPALDPYMVFGATIPVATKVPEQLEMTPPPSGRFIVGTEVVFHDDPEERVRYSIDVSFALKYIGIGRTYSELSDYLPDFNQKKVTDPSGVGRDSVNYDDYADPANYDARVMGNCLGVDPNSGVTLLPGVPCGELNQVDEHMRMTGAITVHLQPSKYFLLRAGAALGFTTNHLITAEKVGTDTDPADANNMACAGGCVGRVNAVNSAGVDERSVHYDPRYDTPGRRFRAEDILNLMLFLTANLTF